LSPLRDGPQCASDIIRITGQPQAKISFQVGILHNGNVVIAQHGGRNVVHRIANPRIVNICKLMREVLVEEATSRSQLAGTSKGLACNADMRPG
jgi:hypothetical protein